MSVQKKFPYRPDIDGLRAIAILLVVLFHSDVTRISGGFIGVDVFFVISGFLIGGIINKEIASGEFSFYRFYMRRILRIAPALFFMMFCISAICYLLLSPLEFREYAKYATAVFLSVPNIALLNGWDYFSSAADLNPLLMTWSLGIEEQFYFILPVILIFASWRRLSAKKIVLVIILLSLLASIILTPADGISSFYLLHTRAWELGAGVLLALWNRQPLAGRSGDLLSLSGMLMIMLAAFIYDRSSQTPGYLALLPVAGAVLVIASAGRINQLILANKPMRFIGKVSYSWYLWHWPLLSIARIISDTPLTTAQGLTLSVVALLIAIFSWRWIEQPFRRAASPQQKRIIISYSVICALSAGALFTVWLNNGLQYRFSEQVNNSERLKAISQDNPCLLDFGANLPSKNIQCMPESTAASIALVGDSHAAALRSAIERYASHKQKPLYQLTKAACPFLIGATRVAIDHPDHAEQCRVFNRSVMQLLMSKNIDEVIVTAYWSAGITPLPGYGYQADGGQGEDNYQALTTGMNNMITRLLAAKKKVTILEDVPNFDFDPIRIYNNHHIPLRKTLNNLISKWNGTPALIDRTPFFHLTDKKVNHILGWWKPLGVNVVRLTDNLCSQQGCMIFSNGLPIYFDKHHVTATGSTIALGNHLH
ncbi:acyltransferase [Erwiniaceae bacterium BAC15a-03b]|uniref:Acyltransferase n=1 Tax=Winslowiella arboricola TaxID=2978220 RepID=A0A9J6PN84_9GAMM|nr:acyltransferase family protein [Winslowiella arboricola]MCU5772044.1 acyltransferase [Winslowiella arboricola]MCU5776116.1 acyltransferase [Winslowiella arboricola]